MEHTFETPGLVGLYVENARGQVEVTATKTDRTLIRIDARNADEFTVEQDGDRIAVVAPRGGGFMRRTETARIEITVPTSSDLTAKLGSSDLTARGPLGTARVQCGSGDVNVELVEGEADLQSGSGDVRLSRLGRDGRIKTGSGDVHVESIAGELVVSTGSGDVRLDSSTGRVAVKSGSGDVTIGEAHDDLVCTTASGDLEVGVARNGRLTSKTASGDVGIGFPHGTPVWTDLSTVSGRISSHLESVGEPAEGQAYVELRATTVSGDITLHHT